MKRTIFILIFWGIGCSLWSQERTDSLPLSSRDSLLIQEIEEVIVISNAAENYLKEGKSLSSPESYLEKSNAINMIRRGAYAWEPMLHGMSTERSIITIDGMRIYHACTDKMDPVTSYVENTNLSRAEINEGQTGAQFGGTIAGSIDLVRRKTGFGPERNAGGSVFAGLETNNKQQIYGTTLYLSDRDYFVDADFTFRDAGNYRAGHRSHQNPEVDFSQFTKYNVSAVSGYRRHEKQEWTASFIFDEARDVGYPGLPMDVSLARAVITSLEYKHSDISEYLNAWETKGYFNTIEHVMDDSHRPVVPIRMDMPGRSRTAGFYSKLSGETARHRFRATLSGHWNNSLAEMTMYPNDPEEKEMYMLTWPDVNTLYGGLNLEDQIRWSPHISLNLSGGVGFHHNEIRSDLGLKSLQLFYPGLEKSGSRILKNLAGRLKWKQGDFFTHEVGAGYGERAPSVSEGYGFYLLNANDNYDYVGNPNMKNEKSLDAGLTSTFISSNMKAKIDAHYFHISDYIIGKPVPGIPPMNMLADGIKIYEQLNFATIISTGLDLDYYLTENWVLSADASYRYGQGGEGTRLPLIQPFNYGLKLKLDKDRFSAEMSTRGSSRNRSSREYGETSKPGYFVIDMILSKEVSPGNNDLILKLGVENLTDRYYVTFDDWFDIPRMGRNFFTNIIFKF